MTPNTCNQHLLPTLGCPYCYVAKVPGGYHLRAIPRGVYGEPSKIAEEFAEFEEALEQGNPVMALQELSDLLGAIKGWLAKTHPSISLQDLLTMQQATERAFQSGHRRG